MKFNREIWSKINREQKFFMFRSPVDTEEVYDYMDYVDNPMDFDMMLNKLDEAKYNCAQDFLDDIDLIAANALKYNSDLNYETNKIICHRARALIDFSYALVKAEMDTDFEDECKEIVSRRKKLTKELEELSDEEGVEEGEGGVNGTHTDGNSSVGASTRKRRKPMRKSAWAKGYTPKKKPRRAEHNGGGAEEDDTDEDDNADDNETEEVEAPSAADTSTAPTPTRSSSRTRSGTTPTPSTSAAAAAELRKAVSDGSSHGSTKSSPKDLAPATLSVTPSTRYSSSQSNQHFILTFY